MEIKVRQIIIKGILIMIIMCGLIYFAAEFLGIGHCETTDLKIKKVERFNTITGKREICKRGDYVFNENDICLITVKMPEHMPYSDNSLVFHSCNDIITVFISDDILFSYGLELSRKNIQIGNIHCAVHIPTEYSGRDICVELKVRQNHPERINTEMKLMPSDRIAYYPINGRGMYFTAFFLMMLAAVFIIVLGIVLAKGLSQKLYSISLGFTILLLCIWYFGYNRFFYVLSDNVRFNALSEYYALDLLPAPMVLFFYYLASTKKMKRFLGALGIATGAFSAVSFILVSMRRIMFCNIILIIQMVVLVLFLILTVLTIMQYIKKRDNSVKLMMTGMNIGMFFAVLQVLSIILKEKRHLPILLDWFTGIDFASLGIMILITMILISVIFRVMKGIESEKRNLIMKKLAFEDALTGIPNRISVTESMKKLDESSWYAVGFFDVDGLKSANDKYGHEEGDKLIRTAANLIGDSFGGKGGFFGRWGGDEFVAVFTEQKEFENFRSALHRGISDINKNTDLKDGFSISDGYVIHEPGQKDSVESLINIADKNMYYYKKKRKKAREE